MVNFIDTIETSILEILETGQFAKLSADQKTQLAQKLNDHFYNLLIEVIVDNLTYEQLVTLKNLPLDTPELVNKLSEYSNQIPFLQLQLEDRLEEEKEKLKIYLHI